MIHIYICQVDVSDGQMVRWSDGLRSMARSIPSGRLHVFADRKSQGQLVECMQTEDNDRHLPAYRKDICVIMGLFENKVLKIHRFMIFMIMFPFKRTIMGY